MGATAITPPAQRSFLHQCMGHCPGDGRAQRSSLTCEQRACQPGLLGSALPRGLSKLKKKGTATCEVVPRAAARQACSAPPRAWAG